jgi:hypothetical protein
MPTAKHRIPRTRVMQRAAKQAYESERQVIKDVTEGLYRNDGILVPFASRSTWLFNGSRCT